MMSRIKSRDFYFRPILFCSALLFFLICTRQKPNDGITQQQGLASSLQYFDPDGYFVFCLSMGRYGNQMEQLLGVLGRIKATNRMLVLPPFISYDRKASIQLIPIESVFDIDRLKEYYSKIVSMETFMETIAPHVWKERVIYCVRSPCPTTPEGNPIRPFWNHYGIYNFSGSFIYGTLPFSLPAKRHPVVTVSSAPVPFPMRRQDRGIAKYFVWKKKKPALPMDSLVVATHFRAGSDWVKVCENGVGRSDYMASPQCHIDNKDAFQVTKAICLPTDNMPSLVIQLVQAGERIRSKEKRLLLFVASDVETSGRELMETYKLNDTYDELLEHHSSKDPFDDLMIMSKADYFIGNCVSSFTSFAARMRPAGTTEYFGVEQRPLVDK